MTLLLLGQIFYCQTINEKFFNEKIFNLNNHKQYKESLKLIDDVLENPKSGNYDKYNAYLQKALTYKRLFNYKDTEMYLDDALELGLKTDKKKTVETRILLEKALINFDQENKTEFREYLSQIKDEDLKHVDAASQAFFYITIADIDIHNNNLSDAKIKIDKIIKLLEQNDPRHLSLVYIKLGEYYNKLKDFEKEKDAFYKALNYAEKSKIDIYVLGSYGAMIKYYLSQKDYVTAISYYEKSRVVNTKYNVINDSADLMLYEREMSKSKYELQKKYDKYIRYALIAFSSILTILIFVLIKLFQSNKKNQKLIENENNMMRSQLENFLNKDTIAASENTICDEEKVTLTDRQKEIIELVKQGKTNKEIGAELYISENTVKYHLKIIYNILGIASRNVLVKDN